MSDFLLELRSEEIPARMQAGARAELDRLFRREMSAAGVTVGEVRVWSTPRRLALIAHDLPDATEPVREEVKGPRTCAPQQALEGFLRKTGLTREQLEDRDGVLYAVVEKPGRATREVLAEAIPAIVRAFSWPKSMRWGAASLSTESIRWVRPLSGIVAILGEDLVECEVGGITSSYATLGHRFHHDGPITIGGAHDYQEKLRACHVIVDHEERQELIRAGAKAAAEAEGLTLVEDERLVVENAGLTEWPVPLLGRFDASFLEVPPEVIQLTARVNQKYFVCTATPLPLAGGAGGGPETTPPPEGGPLTNPSRKREGDALANAFVCTANIEAADGGAAIVDGNRKVLAARLADARFFWEQDRKTPLAEHAKKLARITFHEKLGTLADKVKRVAKLARWLVEEGIVGSNLSPATASARPEPVEGPGATVAKGASTSSARAELADLAEQAARLAKADLVTEMVGEFPELQGVMGGYYARAEGLADEVADAIRDHYKPVGQGDEVPTAPVTVAVSLADKLDTIAGFFMKDLKPTGSKDPFALRRAALGIVALTLDNRLRGKLAGWLAEARNGYLAQNITDERAEIDTGTIRAELEQQFARAFMADVREFIADRLKVQQREAGVRHDLIDAVFALGNEDDLVRLLARVKALQNFIETEDGADLLAAYKRAANILKKEGWGAEPSPLQGRGRSGEAAEGVGAVGSADPADSPHPNPSPEGEGLSAPLRTQGIPRTGEEDPLAMVDDPDLAAVVQAKLALDKEREKSLSYTPEPAEEALIAALDAAEPKASAAVGAEDFAAAMSALASLRAPIDRFFDEVTVNDADPAKRAARLDLLARFRDAVHRVADFSRIEG